MKQKILLLDPHNVILKTEDNRRRHANYRKLIVNYSNNLYELRVFHPHNKFKPESSFMLQLINIFFYSVRVFRYLRKNNKSISLLICGDPWFPYWIADRKSTRLNSSH